jgi:multicomponent Na+:H+ antiporter subunit E
MTLFALNLMLAIVWAGWLGQWSLVHLLIGFVFGYVVLWLFQPVVGRSAYFEKLPRAVGFLGFLTGELVVSSLRVAWDVVTPRARRRPGIIAVPLDLRSDGAITLLAALITLTPGSLGVDVSADRSTLFVHEMFVDDPDQVRQRIKRGFERRVAELLS